MSSRARKEMAKLLEKLGGSGEQRSAACPDVKMPYIQLMVRMLVQAEALNMVESVGNVTRHRTVPVIVAQGPGRYLVRWVPALSGETLAHRYQEEVVDLAKATEGCSDRLDYWSEQHEFLKHWDLKFYKQQCQASDLKPKTWECDLAGKYAEKKQGDMNQIRDIERTIVSNSVVEDIAGFLVTQGPTRRTSCIRFSYAIPTMDSIEQSQIDHQMHVRGALKAQSLRLEGYEEAIQVPYYVQVGSVLYGFNVELNMGCVGRFSVADGCVEDSQCDVAKRRCIALYALRPVIDGDFGAKRSRYRPHNQLELAIAVASDKPVPLPPATLPFNTMLEELKTKLDSYRELKVDYTIYMLIPRGLPYATQIAEAASRILNIDSSNIVSSFTELAARLEETLNLKCPYRSEG